ncbi:MAG: TonB family protein [Pseudomonadota bacterium]
MKSSPIKWSGAILVSLAVHMGMAFQFSSDAEETLMEGGSPAPIAAVGTAFADVLASGSPNETLEPVEKPLEQIEPAEIKAAEEAVKPPIEQIQPVETAKTIPVTEIQPEALAPKEAPTAAPTVTKSIPIESPPETIELAALMPEASLAPHEPTEQAYETPQLETVPVPVKREVLQPKPEPQKVTRPNPEKKKKKAKKNEPRQKTAKGNKGKSNTTAKAGSKDGSVKAKAQKDGKRKSASSKSGNASASNYKGKVQRKLGRAARSIGKRKRLKGRVTVRFVVSRSGSVSGVRIVSGSGSKDIDSAAIKVVHRAAPFPKIPANSGKNSWAFRVPIAFN